MFIDWVSLLLLNMVAGFCLLAGYVYTGIEDSNQTRWAPGFLIVGAVAVVFGGIIAVTWPLPGPYNPAYGEMSVLLGIIFLGAGVAMAKGWDLSIVAWYALFAGIAAVIIGVRILELKLTLKPLPSGVGFILSGLGGVFAAPTLLYLRGSRAWRALAAVILLAAAAIWATTAYAEYWINMKRLGDWAPLLMRVAGKA